MRQLPPLSPRGTARQRLAPAAALPAELAAELREADLDEPWLFLAWQVVAWADGLAEAERASLLRLVGRLLLAVAHGSTRVPIEDVALRAPAIIGRPGERKPFIADGTFLYPQKLLACEDRVAAALRTRAEQPSGFDNLEAVVADVLATARPEPSVEQREAVTHALGRKVAVITGGPGTGKTTIAVAVVRALVRLGVAPEAIAIAAPTGKAAHRLGEALRAGLERLPSRSPSDDALAAAAPVPETLHRLLGYAPSVGTFRHHEGNRLRHRAVIIDEGSMMDLFLADRLLGALDEDALLVLMGDADQLPSVQAGAVFRDLGARAVRLTRSFRLGADRGATLVEVARRVNAGEPLTGVAAERASAADLAWSGLELIPGGALEGFLDRWYAERLPPSEPAVLVRHDGAFTADDEGRLNALHAAYQGARLLCATRGRPTGSVAVNAGMHRRAGATSSAFLAGEPVMMLRNDYDRGLWNGDQGVVVAVRDAGRPTRLCAAFPTRSGWSTWDMDGLRDTLELSFAMTVHKAQGSEFDVTGFILPDAPLPLLSRELVYTAMTRSRRAVTVCGNPAVLAAAIARPLGRSTGLAEKLA